MKKIVSVLCFLMMVTAALPVWGHMLWINAGDYAPQVGDTVLIEVGWGHKFPKDEIVQEERLAHVNVLDPNGNVVAIKQRAVGKYELAVKQKGTYLVYAEINPGVYTKTTEGSKRQNKKGLDNALHCVSYDMRAKAVINAGGQEQGLNREKNDFIEIVPLANPASLKEGDTLPVKFLYKGHPLFRDFIHATYAGFSDEGETFAFSTMVNRDGIANIKILKKGEWLIKVPHKRPYPDQAECDELFYCMTLTFGIK
jgi:uncharacterized GH25 family protein